MRPVQAATLLLRALCAIAAFGAATTTLAEEPEKPISGGETVAAVAPSDAAHKLRLEEMARFDKGGQRAGTVYDIVMLPGTDRALVGGDMGDRRIFRWDLTQAQPAGEISLAGIRLAVLGDGKRAAAASGPGVVILDVESGSTIRDLPHDEFVSALAASPDGLRIATGGAGQRIRVFDVESGKLVSEARGHESGISDLAFSSDGTQVYSSSQDKTVRVRDAASGRQLALLPHKSRVWSLAVSPDGRYILTGTGGAIYGRPTDLDVTRVEDNRLRLWDAATHELVREMPGHTHVVRAIAFSPDGRLAASASFDRSLRVWDVATGAELARVEGEGWFTSVAFSGDGQMLLAGGGASKNEELEWVEFPAERVRQFRLVHE